MVTCFSRGILERIGSWDRSQPTSRSSSPVPSSFLDSMRFRLFPVSHPEREGPPDGPPHFPNPRSFSPRRISRVRIVRMESSAFATNLTLYFRPRTNREDQKEGRVHLARSLRLT